MQNLTWDNWLNRIGFKGIVLANSISAIIPAVKRVGTFPLIISGYFLKTSNAQSKYTMFSVLNVNECCVLMGIV